MARMKTRLLRGAVVSALGLLALGPRVGGDGPQVEVSPGAVVRWPGAEIESCGGGGERWPPLNHACWYPIDLLAAEGVREVQRWREGRRETATIRILAYPYQVQRITIQDDSQVNLSASDLRRVEKEQARIAAVWKRRTPRRFELPLQPPLSPLPGGGRFGARRILNDQPRSPHSGADYPADAGTPVFAAAPGEAALVGDFFFSGRSVFLDHGDGLISMYFHLSEISVEEGEEIAPGRVIGRVGQSGRATGPHLHFGVRWRRARVDPGLLLGAVESTPRLP